MGTTSSGGGAGITLGTTSAGKNITAFASSYGNNGLFNSYGTDGGLKFQAGAGSDTLAYIYAHTSCNLDFYSNGSQNMRLNTSGSLLVGTTSSGYGAPLYVYKSTSNISQGYHESLAAATFGKGASTGDINTFIGADQGSSQYGYVGAVSRSTGYVPLILQPSGGNVGIGTNTSPSAKLEIKPSGDEDVFIVRRSSNSAKIIYGYQSGADGYLELRTGADSTITKLSGYSGTPSYFLSKVGFGTSSPNTSFQIDISGAFNTSSTGNIINYNYDTGIGLQIRGAGSGTNAPLQVVRGSGSHQGSGIVINGANYTTGNNAFVELAAGGYSGSSTTYINCYDSSGIDFLVRGDGKVGIGTGSPSAALHVSSGYPQVILDNPSAGAGIELRFYDGGTFKQVIGHLSTTSELQFRAASAGGAHLRIDASGHTLPGSDNAYNLGSTSYRWANIYTADAHFSNEGTKGNDIDGTTGSWTLQEGDDSIYMINNKTGKRYKIKLEEV